jgi:hypothetical protein
MSKIKSLFLLTLLVLVSFVVLSYNLATVPPGIYADEAVTGINAYSILKTGKDEYGKEFPVAFKFFGSFSPPLYVYLSVIPIALAGLNEESVRIVSVICGSLMLIILFAFFKDIKIIEKKVIPYSLLLFIITPWNFFFARTGYELYLGFFLFSLSSLLLWKSLEDKKYLIPALGILSLSTYASYPQVYSAPIFLISFLVLFYKKFDRKRILTSLFFAALIQVPHLQLLGSGALSTKGDLFYLAEINNNAGKLGLPYAFSFLLSFLYSFFARFINYFSPNSLFFFPDPDPQRSMPELSVFYNWMVAPFLLGLYVLLVRLRDNLFRYWIILTLSVILPPSLTRDPFSTQRALPLLLPFFILISIGLSSIYKKTGGKIFAISYAFLFILSTIMLWRSYFILLPAERAKAWEYGYKEVAKFIEENKGERFVVEQTQGKPSYASLAFYLRTEPEVLQRGRAVLTDGDYYSNKEFTPDTKFGNIETRTIIWEQDIYKEGILVGDEIAISKTQAEEHSLTEVFRIRDSRGYPLFIGYKTNPGAKCAKTSNASPFCKGKYFNTIER